MADLELRVAIEMLKLLMENEELKKRIEELEGEKRYLEGVLRMKYELKPCPFCGSTTAPTIMTREEADWMCDPEEREMYDGENPMVVCCASKKGGCGASTGFCNDDEGNFGRQAAEAWNRRAPDWIPVSERMPEDMQKVLVCTKKSKHAMQATYCVYGEVYCDFDVAGGGYLLVDAVTHWMPLPEPPEV